MDVKYNIFQTGEDVVEKLFFSIDFEPIELWLSSEFVEKITISDPNNMFFTRGLHFWRVVIDYCCELMGKEKRAVYSIRRNDGLPKFGTTLFEYVGEGNFHWVYVIDTKTHNIANFYKWYNVCSNVDKGITEVAVHHSNERIFFAHYVQVFDYLKMQGIGSDRNFFKPTNALIDSIIDKITKNG